MSNGLSKLSSRIEALQGLLYSFIWPHIFMPVLPNILELSTIFEAPFPFVIGILNSKKFVMTEKLLQFRMESLLILIPSTFFAKRIHYFLQNFGTLRRDILLKSSLNQEYLSDGELCASEVIFSFGFFGTISGNLIHIRRFPTMLSGA